MNNEIKCRVIRNDYYLCDICETDPAYYYLDFIDDTDHPLCDLTYICRSNKCRLAGEFSMLGGKFYHETIPNPNSDYEL